MQRAQLLMAEANVDNLRSLPLNFAVPLLEAGSLEENDELQDAWARLLVNAVNADSGVEVKRAFISILEDFGVLEARLLNAIVNAPPSVVRAGHVPTAGLPDEYVPFPEGMVGPPPSPDIQIGLWNLVRLGCIAPQMTLDTGLDVGGAVPTALGKALVQACTIS